MWSEARVCLFICFIRWNPSLWGDRKEWGSLFVRLFLFGIIYIGILGCREIEGVEVAVCLFVFRDHRRWNPWLWGDRRAGGKCLFAYSFVHFCGSYTLESMAVGI